MGGEGSIQGMINSLRDNKALRINRKKVFEINKEHPVHGKTPLKFKEISESRKRAYKQKLEEYKKAQKQKLLLEIGLTIIYFGGFIAFILYITS